MSAAQHYRDGKLGDTLVDSLDELINTDKITPALAMRILDEFDQVHTLDQSARCFLLLPSPILGAFGQMNCTPLISGFSLITRHPSTRCGKRDVECNAIPGHSALDCR